MILAVVVLGIVIAIFGWDRYRGTKKSAGTGSGSEPTSEVFVDPIDWSADARVVRPGDRRSGVPRRVTRLGAHALTPRHYAHLTNRRRHRMNQPTSRFAAMDPQQTAMEEARTGEPAIEIRGLRKSFGEKEAVAGIDLEIAAGSLAGLVGPNGAGKTTSLSMMTGLLRPDGGQVRVNGLDVWADPPAAKALIGVVPAEARLFERLSGAEVLEYAGRLHGLPVAEARSRATQLLDVLDLTADAKRLVADYSTGMRKKATLGCALIHNPLGALPR